MVAGGADCGTLSAMYAQPSRGAGALLTTLVEAASSHEDATALLHEEVVLHRLDGTQVSGRAVVADAITNHGSEASFHVIGRYAESIHVAMTIEGLPGRLVFMLSGTVRDGRLIEIRMD